MKERFLAALKLNRLLLAAFFLPVLVMIFVFAVTGIYPFGEQQIAIIDMYHQYVPFLGELQYKLQEGGSLFYSWNSGGGCNFWCLLSYYGASPLNLLLILFPKKLLMEGVTVVLLIKIGLTGAFMFTYLKNVKRPSDLLVDRSCAWHTVAFSSMYALCSYMVAYYWCIMWIEGVMLLPLVILGLNRLIEEGRMALYTVSLALIVFSNYYIAIMVCIFILVYYPALYFIKVSGRGAKACLFTTLRAVGCSFLAIGMAGAMMIPTYISMKDTYYFAAKMPDNWYFYDDIINILNQLLPNAHLTYLDGAPNLACGMLALLCVVFYFVSKEIPLKEKLLNSAILIFLILSTNINKLNFIWHGMHFPNQLPYRFTFVICFMLVAIGYRAFKRIDSINLRTVGITIGVIAGYYLFAQKFMKDKVDDMTVFFYIGLVLVAMYGAVLVLYKKQNLSKNTFILSTLILVTMELCITTCSEFDVIGNSSRTTYNENKVGITRLGEYVAQKGGATSESGDGTFSRVEMDEQLIHNCAAMYHYRGMGQFSSTLNVNNTTLMEKIGLEGNPGSNRFNYNETNPVTNCMVNVNYLIAKDKRIEDPDFKMIKRSFNSRLYESEYPLSIGYMLSPNIRMWDPEDFNPFNNLDEYVRTATKGAVDSVFIDKGRGKIQAYNTSAYYDSHSVVESRLLNTNGTGTVKLKYRADSNEKYYVFVEANDAKVIDVEKKHTKDYISIQPDCGSIINIGKMKKGEVLKVKVKFDEGKAGRIVCHVCTLDYDKWNKAYDIISENLMRVTECSDTYIKGEIDVKEDGVLVTSIPYENGWKLKVDGRSKKISELTGGEWISTGLTEGKHIIELRFIPAGFFLGIGVSAISIIGLVWLCLLRRRKTGHEEGIRENEEH